MATVAASDGSDLGGGVDNNEDDTPQNALARVATMQLPAAF